MSTTVNDNPTKQVATFDELMLAVIIVQIRRQPLPETLGACLIIAITYKVASAPMLVGWIALSLAIQFLNLYLPWWLANKTTLSASARLNVVPISSFFHGTVTALPLLLFPLMQPFERALLTVLLVGSSVGALVSTAAHRKVFLAYVLPFLVPLPILWATSPGLDSVWTQGIMAVLTGVFPFMLDGHSKDMNRILRESFDIRQERAELNSELKAALNSAETASRAKTRFLASASHDLRQPIQTLSLFAAALALRPLDERSRQIAANMNAALHDLTGELDALLDVSKLDAGIVQIQPSKIRLHSFLGRIHELFADAARDKQLKFTATCPHDAWVVSDRNHLERVIRNLVENSIKYTDSGSVNIAVHRQHDSYLLSIADTGCGIADSEQSRVFEEFYQVNNPERDRKRGLGLGLSIVKRLTGMLNIPLELTSSPHSGTRVGLTLSVAEPELQTQTPRLERQLPFDALHILVIDDEESVRLGMRALLEELGCTVSLGASTSEAVTQATLQIPDILLCDFRLRGADNGIDTIRAVRQLYPDLPALIISGDSAPERLLEAQATGITIIHKPVASEVLLREIAKLSASIQPYNANQSSAGPTVRNDPNTSTRSKRPDAH